MKNKIALLLLLFLYIHLSAFGDKNMKYVGWSLGEALTDFCKKNPSLKISFIYDEMEDYKVKGEPKGDEPMQILQSLIAMNPVLMAREGEEIYIEARQKGKYKFTGRTLNSLTQEPVKYATVLLQNPSDSTTVTYGITDENGYFIIPCDSKNVLAKFSSIGYAPLYIRKPKPNMGMVRMNVLDVKLKEFTMTADSRYALNDRTVYLPTKREKSAAQGGVDLLKFMGIPSLMISLNDGGITTLSGEGVAIFIDYLRADATEVEGLRPEDVKKVEILDYPTDPRFEGVPHAVNFIMTKYEYGGYTKLSDQQRLDFGYGYYSLSSKFTKRRMTYDLYTGFDHFNARDKEYSESSTVYDFGEEKIEKTTKHLESDSEMNEAYLSGRIKYASEKTTISNQLSLRYKYVPVSDYTYLNSFSSGNYKEGEASQQMNSNSLIPSWKGNYQFSFPRSFMMVVTAGLTFSNNHRTTNLSEEDIQITRRITEKALTGNLGITFSKNWNKHSLYYSLNGELADDRLRYQGTNPASVDYRSYGLGGRIGGSFNFGILRLQPSVKFFYNWTSFGNEKYSDPLPGYYISGSLHFNKKNQLSFSSEMSNWTISVAQRSPNLVVQNVIDAVKGNPSLKAWLYNSAGIEYTWFPLQWLSISAFGLYERHTKPLQLFYTPAVIDGRNMMLRTYVKEGYYQIISEGLSASARLLNNSLTLQGTATVASHRRGGSSPYSRTVLNGRLSAVYYLGDFYFQGGYEFKNNGASMDEKIFNQPSYYSLAAGWRFRGLNVKVSSRNFFRSDYLKIHSQIDYSNYKSSVDYYGTAYHRSFWIQLTYTFKYGKKVNVEGIDRGSEGSSGMVK